MENLTNNTLDGQDIVDLKAYAEADKKVPEGKKYRGVVDEVECVFDKAVVTGEEILTAAGKKPVECFSLYLKLKGCDFELIKLHENVNLIGGGVEHFITKSPVVFHYFVDTDPETTEEQTLTPNQILANANYTPVTDYYLVQIFPDGKQLSYKDTPAEPIEMQCPAMKFTAIFKGETPVS